MAKTSATHTSDTTARRCKLAAALKFFGAAKQEAKRAEVAERAGISRSLIAKNRKSRSSLCELFLSFEVGYILSIPLSSRI